MVEKLLWEGFVNLLKGATLRSDNTNGRSFDNPFPFLEGLSGEHIWLSVFYEQSQVHLSRSLVPANSTTGECHHQCWHL